MKSRLILVRHSLPEMDFTVSSHQWHLSDEGRRRCARLADLLVDYDPVAIVSSRESKAVETAEIIAERFGLRVEIEANLHEHDRRGIGRLSNGEFQEAVAQLFSEPEALVFGQETGAQARQRFSQAVDNILARYPTGDVIVVSHGTVMSLFAAMRTAIDGHALWQRLGLPCFIVLSLPELALEAVVESVVDGDSVHLTGGRLCPHATK